MIQIIPSILTNDPEEAKKLIAQCEGLVDRIHIDIIDGKFADNNTIDPTALQNIETQTLMDFHLMVDEPINWIEKCINSGADRIIAQVERMTDQSAFVEKVQKAGVKSGLGLDLGTPVTILEREILQEVDIILVMSVEAGFGGQEFEPSVLTKFEQLDRIRAQDNTPFRLCDDGGITLENVKSVHYTGVEEIVIGRRLFDGDIKINLINFQKAAHGVKTTNTKL